MSIDHFIADPHFGHSNIIKYCKRPFLSKEELKMLEDGIDFKVSQATTDLHDNTIINNINKQVHVDDRLWLLGDFSFHQYEQARRYREAIKCKNVHLIWGNHDKTSIAPLFSSRTDLVCPSFSGGQLIALCHYPMRSWNKSHKGSWHLYGHVHGNLPPEPHMLSLDVGVDTHDFRPWSYQEVYDYMQPRIKVHQEYSKRFHDKERGGMAVSK